MSPVKKQKSGLGLIAAMSANVRLSCCTFARADDAKALGRRQPVASPTTAKE